MEIKVGKATKLALFVSAVLNPAAWIGLSGILLVRYFDLGFDQAFLLFAPVVIPAAIYITVVVFILKKTDIEFTDVKSRPPILMIAVAGLLLSLLMAETINSGLAVILNRSLLILSVTTAITFYWKISFHAIFYTMSVLLFYRLLEYPALLLLLYLLPLLYWSRITLKKHEFAQLILGTIMSFLILI